jgi:hypothetical protein
LELELRPRRRRCRAASLVVSVVNPSLALAGFALTALLDSSASIVLVWRFRKEQHDPVAAELLERHAQTWSLSACGVRELVKSNIGCFRYDRRRG